MYRIPLHSFGSFHFLLAFLAFCSLMGQPVAAVDYFATVNGNWNAAGTWTPAGGPPGSSDQASIGSGAPGASGITVNLTADQSVHSVHVGRNAGTTGTLNLGGSALAVSNFLTIGQSGGTGTITRAGGRFTAANLDVTGSNTFTFGAADIASNLTLRSAAVVNTAAIGNITSGVFILNGNSRVNLGANLGVSGDIDLRGSVATPARLDAAGFNITANNMFVGRFGDTGEVLNDGAITLAGNLTVSRGTFAFDANDMVAGGLFADTNSTPVLHSTTQLDFIQLNSGATTTLVNTGNVTENVYILNSGSRLTQGANISISGDIELRGSAANPSTLDAAGFNISANDMFVGRFGDAGEVLNDGVITLSGNMSVSRGAFTFDANDTVAGGLFADNGATTTLHASTQLDFIQLNSGATTTLVNTGNVTEDIYVLNSSSRLTQGANINISGDVDLRGSTANPSTLDAAGFNITANDMFVGRFGDAGEVLNDGAITLSGNMNVSRGAFTFDTNDTVAGGLFADNGATTTLHASTQLDFIQLNTGATTTLVNTGNVTENIYVFNSGSRLTQGANINISGDVDLRGSSANPSTLDAAGFNITANDMFVGRFGDAGEVLNDGAITLSGNMNVSRGAFTFDANDTVAGGLFADNGATTTLHASTQLDFIQLDSGAITTVVNTNNVTNLVNVFSPGSKLTLAANLNVSGNVELRGSSTNPSTVDAAGFNITANDLYVGRFANAGEILNDGAITLLGNLNVSRGPFALDANDTVAGGLFADNGSIVTLHPSTQLDFIQLSSGAMTTVVNTQNVSQQVNVFDNGSKLTLAANVNVSNDIDLRGAGTTPSTLDAASFNMTARDIYIGRFGNSGQILNDGAIVATRNVFVSRSNFAFDANDSVGEGIYADTGSTVTFHPTTSADILQLASGSTSTIVATGNVTDSIAVIDEGSQLSLSANVNIASDIQIRGLANVPSVLNANGMDISSRNLFVGRFGSAGSLLSADLVTLSGALAVQRSTLTFNGGFDIVGDSITLESGSNLTVNQTADGTRGLSLNGNTLSILDTSVLNLTFDGALNTFGDWIFRWENPAGGDRVAAIQSLITSGKIVVSSPHPFVIVNNGDGFTYVAKFTTDFNTDTALNCADLNLLTAAIVAGSSNLLFDLTGDGQVTIADRDSWLSRAGNVFVRSGNPFRPGDANLDGFVDGTDFGIWNANKFTTNSAWCSGDFNTDGFVDGSDFGIWNANKFTASDSANLVPEPTTIGLWSLLAIGLVRQRSNRFSFHSRATSKSLL